VGAHRLAINQVNAAPFPPRTAAGQAQFARNDLLAEIAFADQQRRDEHPPRAESRQHLFHLRFLLPERLAHLGEKVPAPQLAGVLVNRRARFDALRRTMSEHNNRRIQEIVSRHRQWLTR
jgi:hypothetical protein